LAGADFEVGAGEVAEEGIFVGDDGVAASDDVGDGEVAGGVGDSVVLSVRTAAHELEINGNAGGVGVLEGALDGGPREECESAGFLEFFAGRDDIAFVGGNEEEVRFGSRGKGEVAVIVGGGIVVRAMLKGVGVEGKVVVVEAEVCAWEPNESIGEWGAIGVEELAGDAVGFVKGDGDVVVVSIEEEGGQIGGSVVFAGDGDDEGLFLLPVFGDVVGAVGQGMEVVGPELRPVIGDGEAGGCGDGVDADDGLREERDLIWGVAVEGDVFAGEAAGGVNDGEDWLCGSFVPGDVAVLVGDERDGEGFGAIFVLDVPVGDSE